MLKLARISRMTRKDINKSLDKARGRFGVSKTQVEDAQRKLEAVQQELQSLTEGFEQAKADLLELTDLARTMDLVGSEETRDRKGLRTFMIGGKEHEVDTSDVNDIRCSPYRRKKSEDDNDSNDADDFKKEKGFSPDVSLADDPDLAFASDIIESTAKLRFR